MRKSRKPNGPGADGDADRRRQHVTAIGLIEIRGGDQDFRQLGTHAATDDAQLRTLAKERAMMIAEERMRARRSTHPEHAAP